jgi:RNAse (barnase) inhibitor barstar
MLKRWVSEISLEKRFGHNLDTFPDLLVIGENLSIISPIKVDFKKIDTL